MRPFMTFEEGYPKDYDIRTCLYGDVWFSKWELKLIHTRCFQRLYGIKQLGFADKVYPDAIHSRFNHSLGVLEQADRIARWAVFNVEKDNSNPQFAGNVRKNIDVIRAVGLLHDVFHIPFGHTLEEEIQIFEERHDEDLSRKIEILDLIFAEILFWEYEAIVGIDRHSKERFWNAYRAYDVETLEDITKPFHEILLKLYKDFEKFVDIFTKSREILLFMGNGTVFQEGDDYFGWPNKMLPLAHKVKSISKPRFDPLSEY